MDGNTHNSTRDLVRFILAMTTVERQSASMQSVCQYIYCTFSINDHDDLNNSCHVTSTSSDDTGKDNVYSIILAKYIRLFIYPLFIFMGIFGNSLSCFIMFSNVRRNGYPTSLYLTVLAFIDCLYLLGSALPEWISQIYYKLEIRHLSDFSCRFAYWFGHLATHLSVGLVIGVTVERFIAVQYPLIAHKVNTIKHTRTVLIILIIFFFLIDSPVFFLVKHIIESIHIVLTCDNNTHINYERRDMIDCTLTNQRYGRTWVYIDLAVYTLIPFLLIVTLNSLIIRRLIDAQRFRRRMFRFNNITSRHNQQVIKHRHYSETHQSMEMMEKRHRHSRRFQSVPETKPLALMLRPQLS
jgi:hypothetical protein